MKTTSFTGTDVEFVGWAVLNELPDFVEGKGKNIFMHHDDRESFRDYVQSITDAGDKCPVGEGIEGRFYITFEFRVSWAGEDNNYKEVKAGLKMIDWLFQNMNNKDATVAYFIKNKIND